MPRVRRVYATVASFLCRRSDAATPLWRTRQRCMLPSLTTGSSVSAAWLIMSQTPVLRVHFQKRELFIFLKASIFSLAFLLFQFFYLNSLSQYTSELDHPESLVCISGNSTHWILTSHDNEVKKTTLQKSLSVWGPRHLPNLGRIHGHFSKIREGQVFISALGKFDSKANKVHCIYLTKEDIKNLKDLCNKCNAEHANTINSILGRVI